jgi:hypothetical protein
LIYKQTNKGLRRLQRFDEDDGGDDQRDGQGDYWGVQGLFVCLID